ncbi:MAG: hypothetical protein JSU70_00070 [Phycisphaerales bacterium]|nr:MAG: hypothetical protein JSU70_00070 [Phycisphaerales bacterium]
MAISKQDLVVALGCTGLLLVTLGAVGSGGRRRAKEAVCLSNLRQWGVMFEMFTNDNDGYFNPGWDVGETTLWMNALRPYYGDNWNLLFCPTATSTVGSPGDFGVFKAWYRDVDLPGGGQHRYASSYGINSWTNNMTRDRGSRLEEWFWKNVRGVEGSNNIPVFADSVWHDAWPREYDFPPASSGGWPGGSSDMMQFCIDRHNGAINGLFMDSSARKIGLKELWTLKWHRNFDTEGPWTKAGGVTPADWPQWMWRFKDY